MTQAERSREERGNGNAAYTDNKLGSGKVEDLSEAHRLSAPLLIREAVNCQLSKKRWGKMSRSGRKKERKG